MAGWSGFTDEELRRLKKDSETIDNSQKSNEKVVKVARLEKEKRKMIKEKRLNSNRSRKSNKESSEEKYEDEDAMQNNNVSPVNFIDPSLDKKESSSKELLNQQTKKTEDTTAQPIHVVSTKKVENINEDGDIGVLSDEKVQEIELSNLEKLQAEQKKIEDENKKKQLFIKQTLQEKFKQTQTEAVKLKEIQKELGRLDQFLQNDVEILRNKIDEACVLYSQAQKRYVNAETEYVDAKLDYFVKKENKEQLTEHLYSIIQENELRKAKKLEELMEKLSFHEETTPVTLK